MSNPAEHDLQVRFLWLNGSLVSIWEVGEQTVVLSPVLEPARPARPARRSRYQQQGAVADGARAAAA
jgi:hypothetical protein